jgi:hypothetical protein
MRGKQPMATIIQFQPRQRHGAPLRDEVEQDLAGDDREDVSDRFGEIVLFTGVRYSRWDEQSSEMGAELAPAE